MHNHEKSTFIRILGSIFAMLLTGTVHAGLVDLSSWQIDGSGNWVLPGPPNDSVLQTLNSRPTMFFNDMDSQGTKLSGTIKVETASDDDFIGFVLGYDDGDLFGSNLTTDYILFDWKQGDQAGWDSGMAISRVTGSIDASGVATGSNAWQHNGNVTLLEQATTGFGSLGWEDNIEYSFDISFTSTNITIDIDGNEVFNINGAFEDGSFGFYNYSQPFVRYAGIEEDVIPVQCGAPGQPPCPIPEPSSLVIMLLGLLGIHLKRKS